MEEQKRMAGSIKSIGQSHNYIGITILIKREDYQVLDSRKEIILVQD